MVSKFQEEHRDDKHSSEDEITKSHRKQMEAYGNTIRVYQFSGDPLPEEKQAEVDKVLEEARRTDDCAEDTEEQEEKDERADRNDDVELDVEDARG